MTTSTLAQRYTINGVVNTDNPVMENLDQLARSSGCFLTYDALQGKWGVIINTTSASVKSFDNSNIIGPINITTTNLFDLYNRVEVEFPLLDTADKTDYVRIATPSGSRSPNEPDNTMKMTLNFCTEPVQAYLLGNIELGQSRLDKVVTFRTDYSALQLNAGDVIDITNDLYQFNQKQFRIITIREVDGDSGDLSCDITALEYSADIYSTANLPRSIKTDLTGIQTIGAISTPSVSFNKVESAARPYIDVISTVPTGVIEGVECWISMDGTNYELRETIKSETSTLTPGGNVTFQFDDIEAGTVYAKTRGINYSVAGPFSNVASTSYTPVQITDAIDEDTSILDNGLPLSLLLALPDLLGALDGFLNGDPDMGDAVDGAVTDSIENGNLTDTLVENGAMIVGDVGQVNIGNCPANGSNASSYTTVASSTFVSRYTSSYKVDVIVDQNTSGAIGARGADFGEDEDIVRVRYQLFDISGGGNVYIGGESSGGVGAFFWTDYSMTGIVELEATKTYKINFETSLYTESNNVDGDFTFGWNIYTAG
jgi:hypothetical protein